MSVKVFLFSFIDSIYIEKDTLYSFIGYDGTFFINKEENSNDSITISITDVSKSGSYIEYYSNTEYEFIRNYADFYNGIIYTVDDKVYEKGKGYYRITIISGTNAYITIAVRRLIETEVLPIDTTIYGLLSRAENTVSKEIFNYTYMNNEKYQINILKRGGNLAVHFYDEKGTEITELYMSIKDENSFCIEMNDVTDKKELIMKLSLETGNEATYSLSMNRIKNSSEKKLMNNYLINGIIYNRTIDDKTIEVYRRIQFITNPSN